MRIRVKFKFWFFPILGVIFGIAYAFMFIHGLNVTWHFVGNPSENINKIIGLVGGRYLFVYTDSGKIYSLNYNIYLNGRDTLSSPIWWKIEDNNNLTPDPIRQPVMKFISLPLLFKVKQFYEMAHPLVEGEELVKFALSDDGNLWIWNYGQGGMSSITYFLFPFFGVIVGSILAVLTKVGLFLWKEISSKPI